MANSVAIRLGVEGQADVKRAFDDAGRAGQDAFRGVATALDAAGAASDRQIAKFRTLAQAGRDAAAKEQAQANVNSILGVRPAPTGAARDSASVFEMQARASEEAARRAEVLGREMETLRARFDPLGAAAARYQQALADVARAEEIGAISSQTATTARLKEMRSYEDATSKIQNMAAAQKAAAQVAVNRQTVIPDRGADIAAYGTEMDRLRAKYSPLFAVQREYVAQLTEIRNAVKTGALTQVEGSSALQRTKDTFAKQVTDLRAKNGGGLTGSQAQNLGYQVSDVVSSLGSGSSVTQVAFQQVPQIAQIFSGPGGASIKGAVTQAREAVTGFISRIGVLGGAVGGVSAVALLGVAAFFSYESSAKALDKALSGVGRASGATATQIAALAPAAAAAGNVSVRTARELAGEYAATGKIGVAMYASLIGTAKDYAASTGQDLADANKTLAAAFADPSKGAETLNAQLGFLNSITKENIERLQAQGDRLGAQRALFDAYKGSLSSATELTSGWGRMMSATGTVISDIWDRVGQAIDRSITGGTLEDQIATAQRNLDLARTAQTSRVGAFRSGISGRGVPDAEADLKRLNDLLGERTKRLERAQVAQRNLETGVLVRSLLPEQQNLQQLEDKVIRLRAAITQPAKFGLDQRALAEAEGAFERLRVLARNTREDIEKFGDPAIAAANRQAEFRNKLATDNINPVDRQVAELRSQFEIELRKRNIDPAATRESISKPFNDRLNDPNLDPRELSAIAAARDVALRAITEREGLTKTLNTEIDTIKKEAETRATRSQSVNSYMDRVIGVESGGKTDAKNTMSTATGLGQFLEGTWIPLFKEQFPDRAAGMSDREILARRTDRDDSVAVLRLFTEQNSRFLEKQQIATTDRNLYLAHFAGAQGAVDLLKADRGASAESILGRKAAIANPTIIGGGRTAGDVIDYAGRVITKGAPSVRAADREVASLRTQITLTDQTTEAEARRQKIQELLNDDLQRGGALGRTFATAQDLIKASASQVTPEMEAQRKVFIETADAYAKALAGLDNSKLGRDILFDRSQIDRSPQEQAIASRLRGTGLGMDSAEADALRLNDNLRQTKELAGGVFSGMLSDLRQGVSAATLLGNVTNRIADKFLSMGSEWAISKMFAGSGKEGAGGFLASIMAMVGGKAAGYVPGYATGKVPFLSREGVVNGPGTPTSDSMLVRISDKEAIIRAASVQRYGTEFIRSINEGTFGATSNQNVPRHAEGRTPFTVPSAGAMGPAGSNAPQPVDLRIINQFEDARVEKRQVPDGRGGKREEILIREAFVQGASTRQGQQAMNQPRVATR
ncbi:tail length tape measure protein [Methylobacterium sp. W2]|uniref:phage tail length tape measure family protein n=1 Tax=Methylobacterium sp. W2 TaxID=2598107 RepID=UPI001D0CC819|nr:phage tail length tape measure family protein [Methylobacterium sp. W2]MCC0808597.1 tail length tape measure protein [Methylobacterium sp. W2]